MNPNRAIFFTGHMVDLPERPRAKRRFPEAMEPLARQAIDEKLELIVARQESLIAISAAARGGDILFLEACRQRGIQYLLALPFAPERFFETSVKGAPGGWEERYWRLWEETSPQQRLIMPATRSGEDPYAQHNLWLAQLAKERAPSTSLIALWDGAGGDGPGGTADVVARVVEAGGEVLRIDSRQLLRELESQEDTGEATKS